MWIVGPFCVLEVPHMYCFTVAFSAVVWLSIPTGLWTHQNPTRKHHLASEHFGSCWQGSSTFKLHTLVYMCLALCESTYGCSFRVVVRAGSGLKVI